MNKEYTRAIQAYDALPKYKQEALGLFINEALSPNTSSRYKGSAYGLKHRYQEYVAGRLHVKRGLLFVYSLEFNGAMLVHGYLPCNPYENESRWTYKVRLLKRMLKRYSLEYK
jgi:hypothetical protein